MSITVPDVERLAASDPWSAGSVSAASLVAAAVRSMLRQTQLGAGGVTVDSVALDW